MYIIVTVNISYCEKLINDLNNQKRLISTLSQVISAMRKMN